MNSKINQKLKSATGFKNERSLIEFEADRIQIDFLHDVKNSLENAKISSSELAGIFGTSKSFISQLFSCDKRLNLLHIAKLQKVINAKINISIQFDEKVSRVDINNFFNKIHLINPKDNLFWTSSCKSNSIYKFTQIDTIPSENREEKVLTS